MFKLIRFFLLLVLFTGIGECKQPQLSPKDVKSKIEEILKDHVSHKVISSDLMKRALQNFLEELDPSKTYFIESEIDKYINPSESLLSSALRGYGSGDFSLFSEIHSLFLKAIERRSLIEEKVSQQTLPKDVKSEEFRDLVWVESEEALQDRVARIRSLQLEVTAKLEDEIKGKFFQRIEKRRLNREAEFSEQNPEDPDRVRG